MVFFFFELLSERRRSMRRSDTTLSHSFAFKVDLASQQTRDAWNLLALMHVGILRRIRLEAD